MLHHTINTELIQIVNPKRVCKYYNILVRRVENYSNKKMSINAKPRVIYSEH